MQKFILTFFMFLSFSYIFSQEIDSSSYKHEIGLDATFINNFLPLDNSIGRPGSYLLYYRQNKAQNKFESRAITGDLNLNLTDKIDYNNALAVSYRKGKGKRYPIWKKFNALIGRDTYYDINIDVNKGTNGDNLDQITKRQELSFAYGIGVFAGIEYNITERLSVFTEVLYNVKAKLTYSNLEMQFDADTSDMERSVQFNAFDTFIYPKTLVVFYKFNVK